MSYSGDAAEQVVRMTLEGTEVAAKITGTGAKEIAKLLYAVLRDQTKTKGKTRLANMLRTGKELKVFTVQDKDLAKFCTQAKHYGVLYCVLKDRDATDGITDVMVRAEDAGKINRIFERFQLTSTDIASVRSEVERTHKVKPTEIPEPERPGQKKDKRDIYLDALLQDPNLEERQTANPLPARSSTSHRSVPFSGQDKSPAEQASRTEEARKRPSVRQELKEIREELDRKAKNTGRVQDQKTLQHIAPKNKKQIKMKGER